MAVAVDDSFKKPGAIPFKWEIRPGVPKIEGQQLQKQQQKQQQKKLSPPKLPSPSKSFVQRHPCPSPTLHQKLKPPPGGYIFVPPPEPRSRFFRSVPRTRSERWQFEQPARVRPECVSSGCFPSPLVRRKESKKRSSNKLRPECEPDYTSDLETLSRWSVSSRASPSPFCEYSSMSSFSSYQSPPQLASDAEWAVFGLF